MLRLWLSLAVDAEVPMPLPNLEFKIETGDSLLGPNPQDIPDVFREPLRIKADVLALVKNQFFESHGDEKDGYRRTIEKGEAELRQSLHENVGEGIVDWRIQFAEVFSRSRRGFDVVLANPPYGLLNKRQNQKMGYSISSDALIDLKRSSEFAPVLRGMANACTLFIRRSFSLLRPSGVFVEIFPLAFTCDWSFGLLRSFVLKSHTITNVEAFPERDDHRRRVFASAKMSVCIVTARQSARASQDTLKLRINDAPYVVLSKPAAILRPADIAQLDPNCSIPLVSQNDIDVLRTIYSNAIRVSECGNCFTGEVDLTICRPFISSDPQDSPMHKGAIIDRYCIRNKMSQGEIEFVDAKAYLRQKGKREISASVAPPTAEDRSTGNHRCE